AFPFAEDENHARLGFRPRVLVFAPLAGSAEQQVQESRWLIFQFLLYCCDCHPRGSCFGFAPLAGATFCAPTVGRFA
ncbi:MAG TPA: hypothetical protein VEQ40_00700, partial [Pyrinomonadaceae bacterium]|nr:hypothetical protein [Pyrinomonadaceae bacterium]